MDKYRIWGPIFVNSEDFVFYSIPVIIYFNKVVQYLL